MAGRPHDTMSAHHDNESDRLDRESKLRKLQEIFEVLKALRRMRGQTNRWQQPVDASKTPSTQGSSGGPTAILDTTLALDKPAELLQEQTAQATPIGSLNSSSGTRILREGLEKFGRSPPAMLDPDLDWDLRARLVREEVERLTRDTATRATSPLQFMTASNSRSNSSSSQSTEPPPYSSLYPSTEADINFSGKPSPLCPNQQLQQLEIDYPDQVLCPAYIEQHPIHGRFARSCHRVLNALPLISSPFISCGAYKCALHCGGSSNIDLMTLQLAMRSHRLGPRYGLSVSALFRSSSHTVDTRTHKAILASQSTARIIGNRLILRVETQFRVTHARFDQIIFSPGDPSSHECEAFVNPVICPHISREGSESYESLQTDGSSYSSENTRSDLQYFGNTSSNRRLCPEWVDHHASNDCLESYTNARTVDNRLVFKISTQLRLSEDEKFDWFQLENFIKPMICARNRNLLQPFASRVNYTGYKIGLYLNDFIGRRDNLRPRDGEIYKKRCAACSFGYVVIVRNKKQGEESTLSKDSRVFQVDRYIDFGECRAADLKEWNALTKHGNGWEYYTRPATSPKKLWGKQDWEEEKM
ncbi:ATP-dependent RNA helicase [Venturia inaequalis]|nr:ATP-dependent RNA helicase [Venturia inaequalis]